MENNTNPEETPTEEPRTAVELAFEDGIIAGAFNEQVRQLGNQYEEICTSIQEIQRIAAELEKENK